MIGQTISRYKIVAKIGEDASGDLYQATDTESNRTVSLKILRRGATANPALAARLEQVARIEHPTIARIEEVSRAGDVEYVAMEPAAGESIYDLLERERLRRRHVLRYAKQIASALAAGHSAGIVHGPLNPSAIFTSATRDIKIHDFGFSVLDAPPDSEEAKKQRFGASAPYVAPEQIQGSPPDIRSDIFSFGALLYHLTTRQRPFPGATVSAAWKATLEDEPKPISQVTKRTPRGMDKLLERCLRKSPQRRFQQMGEIEPLLDKMIEEHQYNPHTPSFFSRNAGLIGKVAAITLAAAATLAAARYWWRAAPASEQVVGSRIRQVTTDTGLATDPVLSAGGNLLAYASDRNSDGNLNIWVQPSDGGNALQLTSDAADDHEPAFSPDGSTIAFRSERNTSGIYLVPAKGGDARLIAPEGRRPRYSPDGRSIVYWVSPPGFAPKADDAYKLFVIPAAGGKAVRIRGDFASCSNPIWSPDGKKMLFIGRSDSAQTNIDAVDWFITDLDGQNVVNTAACQVAHREGTLPQSQYGVPGAWVGRQVYFAAPAMEGSSIWRADMPPETYKVSTPPVKVSSADGKAIDMAPYAVKGGRLVFARQNMNVDIWAIPVSANEGKVTGALKRLTDDPAIDISPSLSADGSRLVFQSNRNGHYNLWWIDTTTGKEAVVAVAPHEQYNPVVSPDGSRVVWSEDRIGRYEQFYKPIEGGATELLCETCGPTVCGWSKDGRRVLINSISGERQRLAVSLITLGTQTKTVVLQDAGADLRHAHFSPDGRWIAFLARADGGTTRVYVAPFRERLSPASEWIALTDGTAWESSPQWSPDGKLIYYVSSRDGYRCIWAQPLDAQGKPSAAAFAVYHFHSARRLPANLPFADTDLFVGRNQLLVSLSEQTGNIWSARVSE